MRATYRVLKPGGRLCFYVITTTPGLTDAQRRRLAERDGNEHVESETSYDVLARDAGFVEVEGRDVSQAYIETLRAWKREWESEATAFIDLLGEEEFSRRLRNRRLDIASAEDGLLIRVRMFGIKPAS